MFAARYSILPLYEDFTWVLVLCVLHHRFLVKIFSKPRDVMAYKRLRIILQTNVSTVC